MTQPFDHSRHDWYPNSLGGPGQVLSADGTPRPSLKTPLRVFGVHYGGAGASWLDPGDTAAELRNVELNHARPSGKPNEYNSASDAAAETWEYAGPFRAAHSSGNNDTVWGHLVLYGLETLTDSTAAGLIAGVRRARAQAVTAGYLTANHQVLPHQLLPGARTSCPGPLWTNKRWWNQIIAPLAPTPPGGDDMRPIITFWAGEQWPILVGYDPVRAVYVWRGIAGGEVDDLIARGAAVDGRSQPWLATWKSMPWCVRVG